MSKQSEVKAERRKMHVTAKLSAVIRSSRQRMQAGQSPSAVKSVQPTGETKQRKQQAGTYKYRTTKLY